MSIEAFDKPTERRTPSTYNAILPSRTAAEILSGYEHRELITGEAAHAQREVLALGVPEEDIDCTILLGSAARREVRTIQDDPEDPSDIDLLMVVQPSGMAALGLRRREGAHVSWSRTAVGAEFYLVKRPSVSGQLGPAEVMICSPEGLMRQLLDETDAPQTPLVKAAISEGLLLS